MRQVGSLPTESEAKRFTAYLITKDISALAEETQGGGWIVWSRNENDLPVAKTELEKFKEDPTSAVYDGVEQHASSIQQQEAERHEKIRKNVVQVRGRWSRGGGVPSRKRPITLTLMGVAIVASLIGNFGMGSGPNFVYDRLQFAPNSTIEEVAAALSDPLVMIKRGQVWRLITPIFLHGDAIHLVFNMVMMYQLGGIVEWMRGPRRYLAIVLGSALLSNMAQALTPPGVGIPNMIDIGGSPFFVGMSGVVYALFGYVLIKSKFDPNSGIRLRQSAIIILLAWLVLCMTPLIPRVANMGHLSGLIVGAVIAYIPLLRR